ncbi:MAG: hypothetical protein CMM38_08010 [Rhodospirillaceae bacterium]|nr:hypothetical protein [Rhodospirillaceae bacterium]
MSPRIFFSWLVITVVTVILATLIVLDRPTANFDTVSSEPVFKALRSNPESAAKIDIKSRFGEFLLTRSNGIWITPDRFSYKVEENDVRRLLVGLSDMRYIERKTSIPERFNRLEVEDINSDESESAYVKISNATGGVLAEIIVGRPSSRFIDGSVSGTYIREPDTNNVWLVSGLANVQTRLVPWLQRRIISIPSDKITKINLHNDENKVLLTRGKLKEDVFQLVDMPKGRKLNKNKINSISRSLAEVNFEDVVPRGKLVFPANVNVAKVTTYSGVEVTILMAKIENKYWGRLSAEYVGASSKDPEIKKLALKEVKEINERVKDWAYWLPSALFEELNTSYDQLLMSQK